MGDDIVAQLEVLAEKLLIQWPEPDDQYNPTVVFDAIKEIGWLREALTDARSELAWLESQEARRG